MAADPEPEPEFVTVPELLIAAVCIVRVPDPLLERVRLLAPVTPPANAELRAPVVIPMEYVPAVALVERTIGLEMVVEFEPINNDAESLPDRSPKVTTPELPPVPPSTVLFKAIIEPFRIDKPPENVLVPV